MGCFSTTSIFECATSKRAARFYEAAVGALGLTTTWSSDHGVEIRELILSDDAPPSGPVHLAFRAGAREALDRFYAAALSFGTRRSLAKAPGRSSGRGRTVSSAITR